MDPSIFFFKFTFKTVTSIFSVHAFPTLTFRIKRLKLQLEHLEQFDQALLPLTQWSENFLSLLRSSSQVDIADLEAVFIKLKVRDQ